MNINIAENAKTSVPRKSLVQISFPGRGMSLTYFNDKFDLNVGDYVFVDGKFEGIRGQVVNVSYNFKIRLSDFQKVIAVADTNVQGQFYPLNSYFISFDIKSIPASKIASWFIPPKTEEYITGTDDTIFSLADLGSMIIKPVIAERGLEYFRNDRIEYLSINDNRGYAIVAGTEYYEVEFNYDNGNISNLLCSCYCSFNCKHEFAVMLKLKEVLDDINEKYPELYKESNYFAIILKNTLLSVALVNQDAGLTL